MNINEVPMFVDKKQEDNYFYLCLTHPNYLFPQSDMRKLSNLAKKLGGRFVIWYGAYRDFITNPAHYAYEGPACSGRDICFEFPSYLQILAFIDNAKGIDKKLKMQYIEYYTFEANSFWKYDSIIIAGKH